MPNRVCTLSSSADQPPASSAPVPVDQVDTSVCRVGRICTPSGRLTGRLAGMALSVCLGVCLSIALTGGPALAQTQDAADKGGQPMTLEELEAHIAAQKAELEEVVKNRSATEERAEGVEERLAEREARIEENRQELEDLCRERDEITPGTLEDCLAALEN